MNNTLKGMASGRSSKTALFPRVALLALGASMAVGFSACSSDDSMNPEPKAPVDNASDADAIRFNVVASNATRAQSLFNSNNLPRQFYVSAWAMDSLSSTNDDGQTYIKSDLITNSGSASSPNWVDQSGLRYWPNNGEMLNFFASTSSNATLDYEKKGEGSSIELTNPQYLIPLTVNSAANQQQDLLYASAYRQVKTATGAKGQNTQAVTLDFHHALSQVVFTAQCSNPHLDVKIGSISIVGVAGQGTFKMPADRQSAAQPAWTIPANYTPGTFGSDPDSEQGGVTVKSTVTNITAGSDQTQYALMMLPQTVAAADPTKANPWSGQQAFLKVECIIYNVAKGSGESDSDLDTMIFGNKTDLGGYSRDDYATLYIPVSVNWQMGRRYVYNLQFGSGNGGYNQDGTEALIPIKYNVNTDNWVEAGSTNVKEAN